MSIAASGCRGDGDSLPVASGPLQSASELVQAAERLLPRGHHLVAVTGSGTEAIQAFYDLANAHLSRMNADGTPVTDAQLLFFRGCYIGGAHSLQAANGIDVIAEQALAPSGVAHDALIDGAPYSRESLNELRALLECDEANGDGCAAGGGGGSGGGSGGGGRGGGGGSSERGEAERLSAAEATCLGGIERRIERLHSSGVRVGGMVSRCCLSSSDARLPLTLSPSSPFPRQRARLPSDHSSDLPS